MLLLQKAYERYENNGFIILQRQESADYRTYRFKGSWMCKLLIMAGAKVTGYALEAPTDPSLFEMCRIADGMNSIVGRYP